MIPGVKNRPKPTKEEAAAFHESEGNCNTCQDLRRIKHEKDRYHSGFLYGHCEHHLFGHMFVMAFHPDDPMHMRCWRPRKEEGK